MLSSLGVTPDFQTTLMITPVPKGRPRFAKGGWAYTDAKTKEFEKACAHHFALQMADRPLLNGPLAVDILFQFKTPKVPRYSFPAVRPDLDNLFKGVMDAANGILFVDDSLIVHQVASKVYGAEPLITVSLWRIDA